MQLESTKDGVKIDMSYYIGKVLQDNVGLELKEDSLPSKKDLFAMDIESSLLHEKLKCQFHTNVVKLLYLSRRARPDIITAVGFLCTIVQAPSDQDYDKLMKL